MSVVHYSYLHGMIFSWLLLQLLAAVLLQFRPNLMASQIPTSCQIQTRSTVQWLMKTLTLEECLASEDLVMMMLMMMQMMMSPPVMLTTVPANLRVTAIHPSLPISLSLGICWLLICIINTGWPNKNCTFFEIPYFCSHYRYNRAVFAEVFRNYSRKQQANNFLNEC